MPFTFAHPAIIVPLIGKKYKYYFSTTGLVIGSITPDFESFITFGGNKIYGHTWLGALWYDVPLGIVLSFLFHLVVRNSIVENMPLNVRARLEFCRIFNWTEYFKTHIAVVVLSLIIGIFSHLLWDSFTHLSISDPNYVRSTIMVGNRRLFIVLQYACSVIGLGYIVYFIDKLPKARIRRVKYEKGKYWCYFILVAAVIASFVLTNTITDDEVHRLYTINVCMASLLSSLVIVSFTDRIILRRLKLF